MSLEESIDPQQFNTVVDVVKDLCGFIPDKGCFQKPSLAQHIGQSLCKCAGILQSNGRKSGDKDLVAKAKSFIALYESDWTTEVGTFALNTLESRRFNKPRALPLARDIQKLNAFLAEQAKLSLEELQTSPSSVSAWRRLNKLTLAQVVLFNRRRGGEMGQAQLAQYLEGSRNKNCSVNKDILLSLSKVEQQLVTMLDRFEIRGKRGRRVPVLLTSDHKKQLECLLECRSAVGVRVPLPQNR